MLHCSLTSYNRFSLWSNTKPTEELTTLKSRICKQKAQVMGPGTCGRASDWNTWVGPLQSKHHDNSLLKLLQINTMLSSIPVLQEESGLALRSSYVHYRYFFISFLAALGLPKYSRWEPNINLPILHCKPAGENLRGGALWVGKRSWQHAQLFPLAAEICKLSFGFLWPPSKTSADGERKHKAKPIYTTTKANSTQVTTFLEPKLHQVHCLDSLGKNSSCGLVHFSQPAISPSLPPYRFSITPPPRKGLKPEQHY